MESTALLPTRRLDQGLRPLLLRAVRTASERGWPVLASLTIDLPAVPRPAVPPTGDGFYWEQPSKGICLAGAGAAAELRGEEGASLETLQDEVEALLSTAVVEPAEATPLAFAGFCFDASAWRDGTWAGFPEGLVQVPRLLLTARDGRNTLTLSHLVTAETRVDSVAETLAAETESWLTAARARPQEARPNAEGRAAAEVHEQWDDDVRDLVQRIERGEAEKVVLARRVALELGAGYDLESVLTRLRQRFPECTLFAVRRGGATFIGATPETLVSLSGREVRADCLAGTARRGADETSDRALAEALLADDKERREHALVVRGLIDSLAPVCAQTEVLSEPGIRRTATVQHLHTPFRGTTDRRRHVLDLVRRLHPTPATAGLPRETSMRLIRQHEKFDRGWYAGPLGWLDAAGDGEFAVALRSALVRDNTALLYAGCGIVPGSDPEREFVEAGAKLEAMRWALTT